MKLAACLTLALAAVAAPLAAQDEGLALGSAAPRVAVPDLDGKPVDLGQLIGKQPVVLEFWATWCSVCEELLPRVKAAHAAYGDRVAFFGINVTVNQTRERVRRYLAQHAPPFRTLYDEQGAAVRAYQAPITSYILIIDRQGKVAYAATGADQDLTAALRRIVGS